ncbi:hypothetical protein Vretifemale_10056 [Volvox reticuliferus]|uniref:Uncharacterized protein n=1 Tax=Volvox reticuliferus TaxID=1737510 RepID=A0A8J4CLZ4_9CHLO|nr:hypothetical protein Vretifemale_10056 [Volvox reticuliferus]
MFAVQEHTLPVHQRLQEGTLVLLLLSQLMMTFPGAGSGAGSLVLYSTDPFVSCPHAITKLTQSNRPAFEYRLYSSVYLLTAPSRLMRLPSKRHHPQRHTAPDIRVRDLTEQQQLVSRAQP